MGMALYRKHRPKHLAEVVGQEHITTALANALKTGQISHAYLFTGPRGVGKTSIARILAHEVNGLPYDEEATHLDIIEIDAASNRRIDEIRELRERIHNAPTSATYKVYIIDEVHMLTREAFNALLKTLEEPPAHVIFILATTEDHKLPETIISRTQRYSFRPIEPDKVVDHLRTIAKKEQIKVNDDALRLIAEHGDGSFRDSISLLDQIRNTAEHVTLSDVQHSLGIAPAEVIGRLITTLENASPRTTLEKLQAMYLQGFHAPQIAKQLAEKLRDQLLSGEHMLSTEVISQLLRQLLQVPVAQDNAKLLEIILLEAALTTVNRELGVEDDSKPKVKDKKLDQIDNPKPKPKAETDLSTPAPPMDLTFNAENSLNEQSWQTVLQAIKTNHNTLYSVTRMAVPTFDGDELTLAFSFPFHQKRLDDVHNRQIISDLIKQTTGQNVKITCIVDTTARSKPAAVAAPVEPNPAVETISNIFGGGEMIE